MTQIARKDREELNALSKDVFGTSSRWQKLVDKGYLELLQEEKEEEVPAEKEGEAPTTRKVTVPILNEAGQKQHVVKRHTFQSVKEFMLQQKTQLDTIRQMIKDQNEQAQAKERAEAKAQELHQQVSGSAI